MLKSVLPNMYNRLSEVFYMATVYNKMHDVKNTLFKPNNILGNGQIMMHFNSYVQGRFGSTWRYANELNVHYRGVYPDRIKHYTHQKHYKSIKVHTYGVQKQSKLRAVCNAQIGREAMAEGRPPKIIQVYSNVHRKKPHGSYGKLGDRVLMAIKGEMKKGIIVGLRANQLHGIPRFDSNNVVLIEDSGNPIGNRINVPIPNCIKPILKRNSHAKKADYTKLFAIATKFV